MTITRCIAFAAALAAAVPVAAQESGFAYGGSERLAGSFDADQRREAERASRDAERASRARETELYEHGQEAMDNGRWDRAMEQFSEVARLKGSRADAALYWLAYSQNRQGQRAEALATVAELAKSYPSSRYLKQARALEVEVRRDVGQPVRPESQSDEELKLMALQALQTSDPDRAVPMLQKLLDSTASPRLKSQALFVLAQSGSPRAREVLIGIAKGNSTPELQTRAIQYLGIHGGRENRTALADIYSSSADPDVKRRILRAFMIAGDKERVLAAAQGEQNAEVRAEAVRQLGVMGAHDALWQLYQKESSIDVKNQILQAMFIGGNTARMIDLAKTEPNAALRRTAVRNLGLMGATNSGAALLDIYNSDKDLAVRRAVIQALFLQNNAETLVTLARKEQNAELKKDVVEKLSLMKSKVATDYMLELLNK